MSFFLGIDLGTQSVKVICLDEDGQFRGIASRDYSILTPQPGFAEQNPETWWEKTKEAIREVVQQLPEPNVKALSFSGQMHGAVMLNEQLEPVHPAIIWADQRSHNEVQMIREKLKQYLETVTGSDIATGFMAATLVWVKNNLPEVYRQIRWVFLPKDYLKVKMGLPPSTDVADASSTLLFDIRTRSWSESMIDALGLDTQFFPSLHESNRIIGSMKEEVKSELGIKGEGLVIAGAGDQHCAAIGNGVTEEGEILLTIGTGGQVFAPLKYPFIDQKLRIHTFCHAIPGYWHLLGAILCAGLALSWFKKSILDSPEHSFDFKNLDQEAQQIPPGCHHLMFLPHLIGERTPHMNPKARGAFLNVHLAHERAHFVRAIMEGVGMGMRNVVEIFQELGVKPQRVIFSGGGSKSALWRKIMASVLNMPLLTTDTREEAAFGACLLAMVGAGCFSSLEEATQSTIHYLNPTLPEPEWVEAYNHHYAKFKKTYPALKELFPE
ncbi:MAG: xylulokinase [Atribacterota bacterium]